MVASSSQRQQSWTVDDIFEHRYTVIGLLGVLIICAIVILWLLFSMSRYEKEGDELFGKLKYKEASDKYYRALQRNTFSGKDRLMFKLGQVHAAMDDEPRAIDFLVQLMKDYPKDNYYHQKGQALAADLMSKLGDDIEDPTTGSTTLGEARLTFRRSYRKLLRVLVKGMHKSGNRKRAEKLYRQYKNAHERFQKMLSTQYREAVKKRAEERQKRLEERQEEMGGQ